MLSTRAVGSMGPIRHQSSAGTLRWSAMLLTDKDLLARLVSFDTRSSLSNLPLADFICDYLDRPGVTIERQPGPDGSKVNVVAIAGPEDRVDDGLVLSGGCTVFPWRTQT